MNVGTSVPLPAYTIDPAFMARKAEELGFESIWYAEHPILPVQSASQFPSGGPIPETYAHFTDPYMALARASGVTTTIKLGTGITLVPERNPLLLAKEIASLDRFSGGRFLFGIGAGWNREETEIMGGVQRILGSVVAFPLGYALTLWTCLSWAESRRPGRWEGSVTWAVGISWLVVQLRFVLTTPTGTLPNSLAGALGIGDGSQFAGKLTAPDTASRERSEDGQLNDRRVLRRRVTDRVRVRRHAAASRTTDAPARRRVQCR